jgi:hypothetical protein
MTISSGRQMSIPHLVTPLAWGRTDHVHIGQIFLG